MKSDLETFNQYTSQVRVMKAAVKGDLLIVVQVTMSLTEFKCQEEKQGEKKE